MDYNLEFLFPEEFSLRACVDKYQTNNDPAISEIFSSSSKFWAPEWPEWSYFEIVLTSPTIKR